MGAEISVGRNAGGEVLHGERFTVWPLKANRRPWPPWWCTSWASACRYARATRSSELVVCLQIGAARQLAEDQSGHAGAQRPWHELPLGPCCRLSKGWIPLQGCLRAPAIPAQKYASLAALSCCWSKAGRSAEDIKNMYTYILVYRRSI